MRQVFLRKPWIYQEEPKEIRDIYYKYGKLETLRKNESVMNGGTEGKFYFLKKGLAAFSAQDKFGKNHMLCLVLPGRAFADVDGFSGDLVNINDYVICQSQVLSITRDIWDEHIGSNVKLLKVFTKNIVGKLETLMEAMISNYTLKVDERLLAFWKVLITSCGKNINEGWNQIPVNLSIENYSKFIGASRITISKLFAKWIDEGVIQKDKKEICVHSTLLDTVYDWVENDGGKS